VVAFFHVTFGASFTICRRTVFTVSNANTISILITFTAFTSAFVGVAFCACSSENISAGLAVQESFAFTAFAASTGTALAALITKQVNALHWLDANDSITILSSHAHSVVASSTAFAICIDAALATSILVNNVVSAFKATSSAALCALLAKHCAGITCIISQINILAFTAAGRCSALGALHTISLHAAFTKLFGWCLASGSIPEVTQGIAACFTFAYCAFLA